MKKIILLKGLPASGKSTWAKQYLKENKGSYRVNKDDLRSMMIHKYTKGNEKIITQTEQNMVRSLCADEVSTIIVDNTHFNPKYNRIYAQIAKDAGYEFEEKFFDTGPETCKARNARRDKVVPNGVIDSMYERAVDQEYVFTEYDVETYIPNEDNPTAVIFDIDGTLARMTTRSPYTYNEELLTDELCVPVYNQYQMHKNAGHKIIIFTGRKSVGDKWTQERLKNHNIEYNHFRSRATDDERCDTVIKREFFDEIRDQYNVTCVFDDRDRVVKMYRGLGIHTYQCNYGNF